jgi:RecJ-like exonuclease
MPECKIKHTAYQPDEAHWRCPLCGADNDKFYVEESEAEDCDLLHVSDLCVCHSCESRSSGKLVAARMSRRDKVKPCPCCQGRGVVPLSDEELTAG